MDAQNTTMVYTDQNNNTYTVTQNSVTYDPITPMESSSGTYSGGDPWTKKIDQEVFYVIETWFNDIAKDKTQHLKQRIKPSIVLSVKKGKKKEKVLIVKPSKEFDEYMKLLKTNKTVMD
jgi:hypothetical protein